MKSWLCVLLLTVFAPAWADPVQEAGTLIELLADFLDGASHNDPAAHDRFWADDLVYTSSSGERFGKTEIVGRFAAPHGGPADVPPTRYDAEDVHVRVYGNAAVIAFRLIGETPGKPSGEQYFNTGTFVKRSGEWRAVAWQATRIPDPCPPPGTDREALLALRDRGFEVPDDVERNRLAIALLACVGDPDPAIRDGVVYSGLATWLRADGLTDATRVALYDGLLERLDGADPAGLRRPFAALILSEIARTDRIAAWLTRQMRERLTQAAADYLASVRDYRGFADTDGWRHGVAHGADLALQLVLNPAVDPAGLRRLLDAVASQIAPPPTQDGPVFYTYGEPARLARPVLFAHRRDALDAGWWAQWFERIAAPAPYADWDETWSSNAGLAQRHNTLAFLSALHLATSSGAEASDTALQNRVAGAVRAVSD